MLELFLIIVLVVLAHAIVMLVEAALLSVPPSRVVAAENASRRGAATLRALKENIQKPLASLIVLANVVTIMGAFAVGVVASEKFGSATTGILSAILTVLVIIPGEIVPKTLGERHAEGVALFFARPLKFTADVLGPLVGVSYHLVGLFSRRKAPPVSEEEIKAMTTLGETAGSIAPYEAAMIREVFHLNDITARDLMTPRKKVFYLDGEKTLQELKEKILSAKHSRIPVVADHSLDRVIGIAHQRELLIALEQGRGSELTRNFAKKPLLVPAQLKGDELMREFQKARMHLAVVINEHGEVSGVVTLEDCLEELVGEIIDEKDVVPELIKRVSKDEILVHGETRGRYVNSLFQTALPETKTLSGFLHQQFNRIPQRGDVLKWKDLEFRIEEVSGGEIERMRIIRKPSTAAVSPPAPSTVAVDGGAP